MADGDPCISETLFSFEVLVEYIRIHKPGIVRRGFDPAVGVRLLDFPTLVIYPGEHGNGRHQEDSDSEKENAATHILKHDALLQEPTNGNMEYPFRKGKSCLFKIRLDLLHTHLSNVPLYVMVLDSRSEIPKLLGNSMVSLAKIIDRINTDVKQFGISTPSAQGEKGLFGIHNLMGDNIGCISLGYKLLSLGASLIPHIPESRVLHLSSGKTTGKQPLKQSDNFLDIKRCRDEAIQEPDSSNVLYQNFDLDGQQADVVVSETEAKRAHGVTTGTQTEPARRQVKSIEVDRRDLDNEGNLNVYYPPPLYYSRVEGGREERGADGCAHMNVAMEALRVEDLHGEEKERYLPAERRNATLPEEAQRSRATEESQAPPALLGEALRQLPLLSALLRELSQLSSQTQQPPVPASPGLTWQHQPPRPQPRSSCASPMPRGSRASSPQLKHSPLQAPPPKHLGGVQKQRPAKEAPKSPPKRRLVHRLTRTVRLRLQQHNLELLREQEQREQLWRSQAAALKPASRRLRRPATAKPGHRLPSSPRGPALARGASLDENVQTLVSSVEADSRAGTPPPPGGARRRGGARRTGESGACAVPLSPRLGRASRAAGGGGPALGQNWTVQVRIPSALSQYSDCSEGGGASSDGSEPWPKLADPGFSSPVPLRSESCQASPDPAEYLDDFTSVEPTDGFSPDFPESPEPAAASFSRQASHSDSDSQERRRTQASPSVSDSQERRRTQASHSDSDSQERRRSQASRSDSDSQERRRTQASPSDSDSQERRGPGVSLPVKSNGSPQRCLRGTGIIRPRPRASALSLSSADSERASVSTCRDPVSRRGAARGPSVLGDCGGSRAPLSGASPADSQSLSRPSELDSVASLSPERLGEAGDELGTLGLSNKGQHISELVLSKLPGYTL